MENNSFHSHFGGHTSRWNNVLGLMGYPRWSYPSLLSEIL